jgi:hypothetical protein
MALLALGVLPLVAHMAKQTPRERTAFGAMLLLERMVKRLRRRRRVKDLPLLLLRLLAVLLVALVAAAPQLTYPGALPEYGGTGRVVLVVDASMSMALQDGGSTLLQRARADALDVLDALPPGALVGLVHFSDEAERLTPSLTVEHERVRTQLEAIAPTHGRSDLRGALLEARRLLGGEAGEVLVFTDEAGPRMVADARGEIARLIAAGSVVIPKVRAADPPRNVAVVSAVYGDGPEGGEVTVRIANYGDDAVEVACEVQLPGGDMVPIFADIPPEGESEERVTVPSEVPGGVGKAWCDDPDLSLDDARYFHLPRVGAARVLVVDGDPGDTPTRSEVYFLERALAPWGGLRSGVTLDVTTPIGLADLDPEVHRVVFLANVADPRPFALRLSEFVRQGGNVVIGAGDNLTAERYNTAFGALLPAPLRRVRGVADRGEEGIPLVLPGTDDELWAPFSRAGRSGFGRIRAHKLLTLESYRDSDEVTTWLSYANGMPALLERRVGDGRVMVWTGTFDLAWGNLPLQAVFMPMMQQLVGWLGGEAGGQSDRLQARVGESIGVPLPDLVSVARIEGPDGSDVRGRMEGSTLVFVPRRPGAYAVSLGDAPPMAWVAVNVDPEEGDVRNYGSIVATERELAPELLQRHVDLARPALVLALLIFLAQGLLAMRGVA